MTDFELGFLIGMTMAEGSFTGDRTQPAFQIKHRDDNPEPIRRIHRIVGGVVYGPYNHGQRSYHLLLVRGPALWNLTSVFDEHLPSSRRRDQFQVWWEKYQAKLPPRQS